MSDAYHVLWVDDEIEMLRSHHIFLERKGYRVSTATNGDDAIALVKANPYDLILLDEMMPGKDGLTTLNEIKKIHRYLPVVMVTKSETEDLMEQAIGKQIDGYLIKPVHPIQILSICKQLLECSNIREKQLSPEYVRQFNEISEQLTAGDMDHSDWIELFQRLIRWELELEAISAKGLLETHLDLKRECNQIFCTYIRKKYPLWMRGIHPPMLSPDIFQRIARPHLERNKKVFFILIDCMRLDQWMGIESLIAQNFHIQKDFYYSILPTATPYSRNAIFSGLFPDQIARHHKKYWKERPFEEASRNRFEGKLLKAQAIRLGFADPNKTRYFKVNTREDSLNFHKKLDACQNQQLVALVVNFLDILTHGRSESPILRDLAPNESGFRDLMKSWFQRSALPELFQRLAKSGFVIVIASDHGAMMCNRSTKVVGDRETSSNLRYKYGVNLQCDEKWAIRITRPEMYRLPADYLNKNYLIATNDCYFVYPTNFHRYQRHYAGSFQHGGVSMEEMILPAITLTSRS